MKKIVVISLLVCLCISFSTIAYSLELKAFGDLTFGDTTKQGKASGFTLGQLDLWATQKIDKEGKLKTFLELVIESSGGGFVVDLERLWVEYSILPQVRIRAGRFHTSLGYWNRIHHHGAHMQTTIFRPLFLDFEDTTTAILPIHIIGLMGMADLDAGIGSLHLEIQVGNGISYNGDELDPNNAGDIDEGKRVAARLVFSPKMIEGLGIGFSFNVNPVKEDDGTGTGTFIDLVNQKIYEADLFYLENNVEFIFEYYWISNKDTRSGFPQTSRTSTVWYAQAGYTLFDMLTPYVRVEYFDDLDPLDPYFTTLGTKEYRQTVIGARFDIANNSSIKIEGGFIDEPVSVDRASESYWLQWTFAF